MAKFLQETVKDTGLKADSVVRSDEFKEFFRKVNYSPCEYHTGAHPARSAPLAKPLRKATSFVLQSFSMTILHSTICPVHSLCP